MTQRCAGNVRTYTYDQRNREVYSVWDDGVTPAIGRSYDAAGRLLTLNNGVAALSYTYDNANQLLSETQQIGCGGAGVPPAVVSYSYDLDGNRQTLTYPSGTAVSYGYTARNQLATVTAGSPPPLATYTYDATGNRTGKTLENGTSASYSYDNANRLTAVSHLRGASVFAQFNYTLNSVGNRTAKTQTDNTGTNGPVARAESYGYDAVDQITGVAYSTNAVPIRNVSYSYDAVGNRTQTTDATGLGSITTAYLANPLNQYTLVGADAPTYDANGNLTGQAGWTYSYDAQNRLISASSATTRMDFFYDARNRCVRRTTYGSEADGRPLIADSFLTYDNWNLIEERDATGTLLDKYVHGANVDEILVRYNSGAIYYHHDGLGSVTHLTDAIGSVVESYQYDVYGAATILAPDSSILASSAYGNRFLFTGREWLPEVGLYDYRNRFYSPVLGRWLSRDPIGIAGGLNLYAYVSNNPLNLLDFFGLADRNQLNRLINKTRREIQDTTGNYQAAGAIADKANATNNQRLMVQGGSAAFSLTALGVNLVRNATANALAAAGGTSTTIPVGVWTSNGTIGLAGSPEAASAIAATTAARNAGAIAEGWSTAGPELAQWGGEKVAGWLFDPAGKSIQGELNLAESLSQSTYETIAALQNALKRMLALLNEDDEDDCP